MKSVLVFDSMLTPKLITALYWLLLVISFLSGVGTMFSGYGGVTFMSFLLGLVTMVGCAVAARIWCELMIVIFKINDNLQGLRDSNLRANNTLDNSALNNNVLNNKE